MFLKATLQKPMKQMEDTPKTAREFQEALEELAREWGFHLTELWWED